MVDASVLREGQDGPPSFFRKFSAGLLYVGRIAYNLVKWNMILSFRDKRPRAFFEGERVKAFQGFERQAMLRLDRLHSADCLMALNTPGNRLEGLKGDRRGQYSIRINDQWRICFEWPDDSPGPLNVEIVDYH